MRCRLGIFHFLEVDLKVEMSRIMSEEYRVHILTAGESRCNKYLFWYGG